MNTEERKTRRDLSFLPYFSNFGKWSVERLLVTKSASFFQQGVASLTKIKIYRQQYMIETIPLATQHIIA